MTIKMSTTITAAHWQLYLLADPNPKLVTTYLRNGIPFEVRENKQLIAVLILLPIDHETLEIKNIAVAPQFENHGLGTKLLRFSKQYAEMHHYSELVIATGSTSFKQLYLYQKFGFRLATIKSDFFTKNYPQPIYENQLQLRDMIVLTMPLL